jgi:hypothetical protein
VKNSTVSACIGIFTGDDRKALLLLNCENNIMINNDVICVPKLIEKDQTLADGLFGVLLT